MQHTNKDGNLSAYALACGYVQSRYTPGVPAHLRCTLYREHDLYVVRDHAGGTRGYDTVAEARKAFFALST